MEHRHIIGKSGFGKSTLMKSFILKDISAGRGVFYIDPHGTDILDLIQYIPKRRLKDVILFDPSDHEYPIPFSPFTDTVNSAVATSAIETGIKDAYHMADASTGVMSLYIRATLSALIQANEPFLGFPFFVTSQEYRTHVLQNVSDPLITRFWSDFDRLNPKERRQETNSTYNKAFALMLDTRLRNIFGQRKNKLSMLSVLEGKIVLARLPQGQLGLEQTRILGILMLSQLHHIALSGVGKVPASVYVDEVHTFDGATLREMFSGIRKYGVEMTVAHQNLLQLEPELRSSILGNALKHVFCVSLEDNQRLNEHLGPQNIDEPLNQLPRFTYRRFDGTGSRGYTDHQTESLFNPQKDNINTVRAYSRHHYAIPEVAATSNVNTFIESA